MVLAAAKFNHDDLIIFFLSLALLLGLARLLGEIARQYRQPAILGEILAGILLGPTVLGSIAPPVFGFLFPDQGPAFVMLKGYVELAVALLLLVVGLEVDLSTVWRQGKTAIMVSGVGIIIPFVSGLVLASLAPRFFGMAPNAPLTPFILFFGIALAISALPVIAKIMMDLNMSKSDIGVLILSAAMLDDSIGWIGFATVLALIPTSLNPSLTQAAVATTQQAAGSEIWTTIVFMIIFLVGMLTIGRWLLHRSLPYIQAHWTWPGGMLVFVLVIALFCAALTEYIGVSAIFGAFIAGVALGDSHHLRERTRDTVHQFITHIFAPVFFASIGLRLNFVSHFDVALVFIVLGVAAFGKVSGAYLGARLARMNQRESWAVGFGMASQGSVGIILGQLAHNAGLITDNLLIAIVIMALVTSLCAGPAMQAVLRRKQQSRLKDMLGDRNIIIEPKANAAEGLIRELCTRAASLTGLRAGAIYDAVMRRERIMPTGLPGNLAVPHARLAGLAKSHVVVAQHQAGVDFDAADGEPAHLIFLLLTPEAKPEAQLELLDRVARTFMTLDARQRAFNAASSTELLAVINQIESPTVVE